MKRKMILLPLSLLALGIPFHSSLGLPAAKKQNASVAEKAAGTILSSLREGFHVEGSYRLTTSYPEGYESYDSVSTGSFAQDYGFIENSDGTQSRAARIYSGDQAQVYFEGEDRYAKYEVLSPDNTVETLDYGILGMNVIFNEAFRNPFDYVLEEDIAADLSLDAEKASFVLSSLTGIDRAVSEASFVLEGDEVVGIDFTLPDKQMGLATNDGFLTVLSAMEVELSLDQDVPAFAHLTPSTNDNADLATALQSFGDNYTVVFRSNGLENESALYVTSEGIYYQQNAYERGPRNGDVFYASEDGIYRTYQVENGSLVRGGISATSPVSQYLNGLFSISPALFVDKGEETYSMIEEATAYGAGSLLPAAYDTGDGNGLFASIQLRDQRIKSVTSLISSASLVTFVMDFSDYGTTTLPAFVDIENL